MSNEKKQVTQLDKAHEEHQPSDKALKGETIKSKDDNALNEQQKARDAVKSFKLTKDGQESCMIVGLTDKTGKQVVVKDERPLRQDEMTTPKDAALKETAYTAMADGLRHQQHDHATDRHTAPAASQAIERQSHHQDSKPHDGMFRITTESHDIVQKNGDKVNVTTTHNADGSASETSVKPNGDKEVGQRDSHGRETERVKSHKPRFGENSVDERIVTNYDEKTGMPKTAATKYDMVGRESEKTTSDVMGNSHSEKYRYDKDNSKHVSETTVVDAFDAKTVHAKYDEQDRKVSQNTSYKNGQTTDHETWAYGPAGIVLHEKNGRIDNGSDDQWRPGKTPDVILPGKDPDVILPSKNPDVILPSKNPDVILPGKAPTDSVPFPPPGWPHGGDGLSIKPVPIETESHQVMRTDGTFDQVTSSKNNDGSTYQKTTHPDGSTESVSKDSQGRETERVKTHNTPLGEVIDERVQTSYNKQTGWPEATTTHYDMSGRETERVKEDAFGNRNTEKYQYDAHNKQYTSEEISVTLMTGTSTDTKYDAQHHPTERTTNYSDGRPADHERWQDVPGGGTIYEKNGHSIYEPPLILRNGAASEGADATAKGSREGHLAKPADARSGESHIAHTDSTRIDDSSHSSRSSMEKSREHLLQNMEHQARKDGDRQGGSTEGKLQNWADTRLRQIDERLAQLDKGPIPDVKERELLKAEATKLKRFEEDLKEFKERSARDGVPPEEVEKTLKQIERLQKEQGDNTVSHRDRAHLAEQILHHAAYPHQIDQGQHETCNVATVEDRMFTKSPGEAARVIADIALHGYYESEQKDKNGLPIATVVFHPHKDSEAKKFPWKNEARTYASEIFQIAAVNIHYDMENKAHAHDPVHQDKQYVQHGDQELIVDKKTGKPILKDGKRITDPDVPDSAFGEISDAITGKNEGQNVAILNDDYIAGDKTEAAKHAYIVHNEAELEARLQNLGKAGLPVIIGVNTNCDPFLDESNSGGTGKSQGGHVVTITDFQLGPDGKISTVMVNNQWGQKSDHLVNFHDLYIATQSTADAVQTLTNDINNNKAHGHIDLIKDMERARLGLLLEKGEPGKNDAFYQAEAKRLQQEIEKRYAGETESDRRRDSTALVDMIAHMPTKDRAEMILEARGQGVLSDEQFFDQLVRTGVKLHKEQDAGTSTTDSEKAYQDVLNKLPPQWRRRVQQQVKKQKDDENE